MLLLGHHTSAIYSAAPGRDADRSIERATEMPTVGNWPLVSCTMWNGLGTAPPSMRKVQGRRSFWMTRYISWISINSSGAHQYFHPVRFPASSLSFRSDRNQDLPCRRTNRHISPLSRTQDRGHSGSKDPPLCPAISPSDLSYDGIVRPNLQVCVPVEDAGTALPRLGGQ